jgi:hypothetical protein
MIFLQIGTQDLWSAIRPLDGPNDPAEKQADKQAQYHTYPNSHCRIFEKIFRDRSYCFHGLFLFLRSFTAY